MSQFSIGVIIESFGCPLPEALKRAEKIGAQGIQLYASMGETTPEKMDAAKRRELLAMCKDRGLVLSALCGDFGKDFDNPEVNPGLIEDSKRVLDMAKDLETNIVTTHIGKVPDDPTCDRYKIMQEACHELAEYADSLDAHFAIETGPERAEILCGFLDSLNSTGVAVNLDPANLIMSSEDDPVKGVHVLKKYIVHTHAKDGLNLRHRQMSEFTDPSVLKAMEAGRKALEMPLGQGDVPWDEYLRALKEIGYSGFLTIEREVGADPTADIFMAADFLRGKMATL